MRDTPPEDDSVEITAVGVDHAGYRVRVREMAESSEVASAPVAARYATLTGTV